MTFTLQRTNCWHRKTQNHKQFSPIHIYFHKSQLAKVLCRLYLYVLSILLQLRLQSLQNKSYCQNVIRILLSQQLLRQKSLRKVMKLIFKRGHNCDLNFYQVMVYCYITHIHKFSSTLVGRCFISPWNKVVSHGNICSKEFLCKNMQLQDSTANYMK